MLKSLLRVVPLFLLVKIPAKIEVPLLFKLLPALTLSLILTLRFQADGEVPGGSYVLDGLVGLAIAVVVALFLAAAMQATKFLREADDECEETDPWRQVLDSFMFIVLGLLFFTLRIERNILELLATVKIAGGSQFSNPDTWTKLLKELFVLGLKVSSFGFVLAFTKALFSEIYRRLGGESLKIVFSLSFWILLLILSPIIVPAFGGFLSAQLSGFWRTWLSS